MTLFQLLSMNARLLVWSDEETSTIYTWNQSVTLQAWSQTCFARPVEWEEVAIRTLSTTPRDFAAAREAAKAWALESGDS